MFATNNKRCSNVAQHGMMILNDGNSCLRVIRSLAIMIVIILVSSMMIASSDAVESYSSSFAHYPSHSISALDSVSSLLFSPSSPSSSSHSLSLSSSPLSSSSSSMKKGNSLVDLTSSSLQGAMNKLINSEKQSQVSSSITPAQMGQKEAEQIMNPNEVFPHSLMDQNDSFEDYDNQVMSLENFADQITNGDYWDQLHDYSTLLGHKRNQWNKFNGAWGKRMGNWNKLQSAWGKRIFSPSIMTRSWNNLNGAWGRKRVKWNELNGMWGRKRSPTWNKMSSAWGKKKRSEISAQAHWNKLRGMWGKKRSISEEKSEDSTITMIVTTKTPMTLSKTYQIDRTANQIKTLMNNKPEFNSTTSLSD